MSKEKYTGKWSSDEPEKKAPPPKTPEPVENVAGYSAAYLDNAAGLVLTGDVGSLKDRGIPYTIAVLVRALYAINRRLLKMEAALGE